MSKQLGVLGLGACCALMLLWPGEIRAEVRHFPSFKKDILPYFLPSQKNLRRRQEFDLRNKVAAQLNKLGFRIRNPSFRSQWQTFWNQGSPGRYSDELGPKKRLNANDFHRFKVGPKTGNPPQRKVEFRIVNDLYDKSGQLVSGSGSGTATRVSGARGSYPLRQPSFYSPIPGSTQLQP